MFQTAAFTIILVLPLLSLSNAFIPQFKCQLIRTSSSTSSSSRGLSTSSSTSLYDAITSIANDNNDNNEFSNVSGFSGSSIRLPDPERITEYEITIDGEAADLGKFSEAIYKKIIGDAKNQRFQGFR